MKKWMRNLTTLLFLMAVIVSGVTSISEASQHNQSFGNAFALISSLDLTAQEQTALTSALSTYGPAVKTARQQFQTLMKQMKTDLYATPPIGSTLASDATALAAAKDQFNAKFQNRLDAKTGRLLLGYIWYMEKH